MVVRKSVLFLLILVLLAITANGVYFWYLSSINENEPETTPTVTSKPTNVVPPPLEMMGQGARMPTPEELEDEARFTDQQVALATQWLNDSSIEKRVAGAEQLSAFPTPESEKALINTLGLDFDPEVRRSAAQSLAAFKQPSEMSVTALLTALQDDHESVQIEALNTLISFTGRMAAGSAPFKSLLSKLSVQAKTKQIKPNTRLALRAFLKEQQPLPPMMGISR
jgi:hypothetical protein